MEKYEKLLKIFGVFGRPFIVVHRYLVADAIGRTELFLTPDAHRDSVRHPCVPFPLKDLIRLNYTLFI